MFSREKFMGEVKTAPKIFVLIKGEMIEQPLVTTPTVVPPLLKQFKDFVSRDLTQNLPPIRDV